MLRFAGRWVATYAMIIPVCCTLDTFGNYFDNIFASLITLKHAPDCHLRHLEVHPSRSAHDDFARGVRFSSDAQKDYYEEKFKRQANGHNPSCRR